MPFVPKKLYYKIREVCEIVGVEAHVLRFWETEFPSLVPPKSKSGQRTYRPRDIELLLRIRKLLYVDGFTIAGARKQLSMRRPADVFAEEAILGSPGLQGSDLEGTSPVAEEKLPGIAGSLPDALPDPLPSATVEPEQAEIPYPNQNVVVTRKKHSNEESPGPDAGKAGQSQKPPSERLKRVQSELENILTLLDRE